MIFKIRSAYALWWSVYDYRHDRPTDCEALCAVECWLCLFVACRSRDSRGGILRRAVGEWNVCRLPRRLRIRQITSALTPPPFIAFRYADELPLRAAGARSDASSREPSVSMPVAKRGWCAWYIPYGQYAGNFPPQSISIMETTRDSKTSGLRYRRWLSSPPDLKWNIADSKILLGRRGVLKCRYSSLETLFELGASPPHSVRKIFVRKVTLSLSEFENSPESGTGME